MGDYIYRCTMCERLPGQCRMLLGPVGQQKPVICDDCVFRFAHSIAAASAEALTSDKLKDQESKQEYEHFIRVADGITVVIRPDQRNSPAGEILTDALKTIKAREKFKNRGLN